MCSHQHCMNFVSNTRPRSGTFYFGITLSTRRDMHDGRRLHRSLRQSDRDQWIAGSHWQVGCESDKKLEILLRKSWRSLGFKLSTRSKQHRLGSAAIEIKITKTYYHAVVVHEAVISCQGSNRNRNRCAQRRISHYGPQSACVISRFGSTPNWVQDSYRFYCFWCTWLNVVLVCLSSKVCGDCLVDIDGDCS